MAKWGHNLPSVLNPIGDICVNVHIPAHPDYIKLFVRAIRQLETNRIYERDEDLSAKIVVEQWRNRTVTPLIEALATGTGLCGLDGECLAYPPFASFISYSPQNPYTEPDLVPDGYEQPPFYVNGKDNAHDLPNYKRGDVILDFGSINLEPSWDLANTPRIELCLEGSGVAEIHLLQIVQGGVAVVSLDNPVDLGDIIAGIIGDGIETYDLNQDIVSLPPETAEEVILEVEVPTEGEHIIYIYFLPVVNDSLIPLGFGGGLREISLCGNLRPCGTPAPEPPPPLDGVTELRPEFQFTADCGMEYRLRDQNNEIVQDWTPVAGWSDNADLCFGVGGGMATVEEICQAIECGLEKAAARYLSGTSANLLGGTIEINDGNEITVVPPGQAPDDTTSSADEEARSGGASGIRLGINLIWANLSSWYVGGISEATAAERLKVMYELNNDQVDLLVSHYYFQRGAAAPYVSSFASTLDGYLYCKGTSIQTVFRWIYEIQPSNLQVGSTLLGQSLTQNQLNYWFNQGKLTPSTDYADYSCTKTPSETVDVAVDSNTYYAGVQIWKVNHRIRVTVSGFAVDAQGDRLDFWWNKSSAGVLTFKNNDTRIEINGQEQEDATQNEVPFNEAGAYSWTFISQHTGGIRFRVNRGVGIDLALEHTFSVLVEDLGEIIT